MASHSDLVLSARPQGGCRRTRDGAPTCASLRWGEGAIAPSLRQSSPREDRGLVVLDALSDAQHRLDAIESAGVLAHQLFLRRRGHLVLGHVMERVPGVLGVMVW